MLIYANKQTHVWSTDTQSLVQSTSIVTLKTTENTLI